MTFLGESQSGGLTQSLVISKHLLKNKPRRNKVMVVEWDLEVSTINQNHDWMEVVFMNNKKVVLSIEEWRKLGKPGTGDLLFITIEEEK